MGSPRSMDARHGAEARRFSVVTGLVFSGYDGGSS